MAAVGICAELAFLEGLCRLHLLRGRSNKGHNTFLRKCGNISGHAFDAHAVITI